MIPHLTENVSSIFSHITISEIEDKISNFQKIDLKRVSDKDLMLELFKVMNINVDGQEQHVFFPQVYNFSAGTRFYRVRKIKDMAEFYSLDAYWNPPKEKITNSGRLNKVHESLLYTSLNHRTTLSEIKIDVNQRFALIVYEAIEPIKLTKICDDRNIGVLSEIDNRKYQMYNDFLRKEFTKEVQPGLEYLYRVSECIAKCYFDLPHRVIQDAWLYPSVASNGDYNVCFRPDIATEVLRFVGVIICTMVDTKNISFERNLIGVVSKDNKILFSQANAAKIRDLFPGLE